MEERKMEDLMIDYVEGNLKGELKDHVERTIEKSDKWQLEFDRLSKVMDLMGSTSVLKPDQSLRNDFDRMLLQEIESQDQGARHIQMGSHSNKWFLRIAASVALILLGTVIGMLVTKNQENEQKLMALKSEMELTKNLVISSLQNQSSASSRLNGVNTSMSLQISDDEIITVLVKTMNTDENTNVRLAAVSALARFSNEMEVRKALLNALETQEDPVVLIDLINLMVKLKEDRAIDALKSLLHKNEVHEAVKDEAHLGIIKLS